MSDSYTLIISDTGVVIPASNSVTSSSIIDNNVTLAKVQKIAAKKILGNSGTTTANVSAVDCSAVGFGILSQTTTSGVLTYLGFGSSSMALQDSSSVVITGGTLTGVNVSGTLAMTGGTIDGVTITNSTISDLTISVDLTSENVSGILPIARGGTGSNSGVGLATSLVSGVLPTSKGGTGSSSGVDLTTSLVTGTLPVSKGGTGVGSLSSLFSALGFISGSTTVSGGSQTKIVTEITGVTTSSKVIASLNTVDVSSTYSVIVAVRPTATGELTITLNQVATADITVSYLVIP